MDDDDERTGWMGGGGLVCFWDGEEKGHREQVQLSTFTLGTGKWRSGVKMSARTVR